MTQHYQKEISSLSDVYATAMQFDIHPVASMVESSFQYPLLTVGSGGSFSVANFAAELHQRNTGLLSRASTPLELVSGTIPQSVAIMCFSAGGNNSDICTAFKHAALEESGRVAALVFSENTKLHALQEKYTYTDVVGASASIFRDGFLSVATLLASSILLTRAYDEVLGSKTPLPSEFREFSQTCLGISVSESLLDQLKPILSRRVTSVLYSSMVRSTAIDLESRFVEAALGSLHVSDFRNFGHGRHHWMSKHGEETGVIAIFSDKDQMLADRTIGLLPNNVPVVRQKLQGHPNLQSIAGLVFGLYVSEVAGYLSGIDPGKPGIPTFGRKLYRLGPCTKNRSISQLNQRATIKRKAPEALNDKVQLEVWTNAYQRAIEKISQAKFGGVVFDYDGTISDQRDRYAPLSIDIRDALVKLLEQEVLVGIATGRGASAGHALREKLPKHFWDSIVIGYYNGALVTSLANMDDSPIGPFSIPEFADALKSHPLLGTAAIRSNEAQISIHLSSRVKTSQAISVAHSLLDEYRISAEICASDHSIDLLFLGASKTNVVKAIQAKLPEELEILRIGDKGLRPGNDADLLNSPFGLSVNEVSNHHAHCWALAPAGIKGIQATLFYLSRLNAKDNDRGLQLAIRRQEASDAS